MRNPVSCPTSQTLFSRFQLLRWRRFLAGLLRYPMNTTDDAGRWPTTMWGDVEALLAATPERRRKALSRFMRAYEGPVFEYLLALGFSAADAEDIRQRFFVTTFDHRRLLERADQKKGKLRNFVRRALRRFAANVRRDEGAQKRGGNVEHVALDSLAHVLSQEVSPDEGFDRAWAHGVLARTEARLEWEYGRRGEAALWETLHPCLVRWTGAESQADAAKRLGVSASALSTALSRLRARYEHVLFLIVSETAATPQEAGEDLLYLRRLLSR